MLESSSCTGHLSPSLPYKLYTDASMDVVGAVLTHDQDVVKELFSIFLTS